MRVMLGLLLLACCGGLVSAVPDIINPDGANTFHVLSSSPSGWMLTGSAVVNPTLNMTIGTTYYISIEFTFNVASANHPFGLNKDQGSTTLSENGLVSNSSCGGTAAGYTNTATTAPFCVLAFTPTAVTNATSPLYYHCSVHPGMVGFIQVNAAAAAGNGTTTAPTTPAPSNNATTAPPTTPVPTNNATTAPPTANTINPDATNTFHVIGAATTNNVFTGWIFTSGGNQFTNPTLNVAYGKTYTISIEFPSTSHPFGLNTDPNQKSITVVNGYGLTTAANATTTCGTANNGYTATTTCTLTFTPPANTPQPLYYHCVYHEKMVGQIVVSGLPSSGFALVPGFAALFAVIAGLFAQ